MFVSRCREQHPERPLTWYGRPLTEMILGSTVRPVGFESVLLEHKLENQRLRVFMPLQLLQTPFLLLVLQVNWADQVKKECR